MCYHKTHSQPSPCPSVRRKMISLDTVALFPMYQSNTCTHLTVSVWPIIVTLHAILDHCSWTERSHTLMVESVEPLTNRFPSKWRQRTVPEWPTKVITDHGLFVRMFQTAGKMFIIRRIIIHRTFANYKPLIVLSWDPLTILVSSNWMHEMPWVCPSKVLTWHCPRSQFRWSLKRSANTFLQQIRLLCSRIRFICFWCPAWLSLHIGFNDSFCHKNWALAIVCQYLHTWEHLANDIGSK